MSAALQEAAMLVTLTIRQWTARKHDRTISNEVDQAHNAKDGGRYNKLLIAKSALDPISKIEGAARNYFYKVTWAWGDNAERILPGELFLDFSATINQFRSEFYARVRDLEAQYPTLMQEARVRLGTMYDPADYPASIRDKFDFPSPAVTPIPTAQDFRVNLSEGHIARIRTEIEERMAARTQNMVTQCWERMREHLTRISKLGDEKAKVYDSVMDNPREFVALLPAMNLTNDAALAAAGRQLHDMLVTPDRLRNDKGLRLKLAAQADEMLRNLP